MRRLLTALAVLAAIVPAGAGELPDLKLRTLAGAALQWPADLPSGGAILLLVHDEDQQPQARSWTDFLAGAEPSLSAVPYFIVPVLPRRLSIVRSIVEQSIRNAAATPADLARTVPLFADATSLLPALGLPVSTEVQLVLVDGAGEVRAAFAGAFTPAAGEALVAALDAD